VSTKGRLQIAQSIKVGAVRLTDAFLPNGDSEESGVKRLRAHVASVIAPLAHEIRAVGFSRTVLSSGTCETIARLVAHERGGRLPQSMNGFSFSKSEFTTVIRKIMATSNSRSRQDLPGMDSKRSDIIVAGTIILEEITKALRIDSFEFSEYALREGVLVDTAQNKGLLQDDVVDAGLGSVLRLAERCSVDLVHSNHVAFLSRKILTLVSRRFDVDASLGRLLEAAALLLQMLEMQSHIRNITSTRTTSFEMQTSWDSRMKKLK
jgi:exopolyphosphatase/guanosine-5'-triphosphate,3'-diphosphate pyrophosphatase